MTQTLAASGTIYGYRVSAIEHATLKIESSSIEKENLNSIKVNDKNEDEYEVEENINQTSVDDFEDYKKYIDSYLEKETNLTKLKSEKTFFNAMFFKIVSKFDEGGYDGLMTCFLDKTDKGEFVFFENSDFEMFQETEKIEQQNEAEKKLILLPEIASSLLFLVENNRISYQMEHFRETIEGVF